MTEETQQVTKVCCDCGETKALDAFRADKKRSAGRGSYCKDCMLVRSRASYRKRKQAQGLTVREPESLPTGLKRCGDCGAFKPLDEFPRNRNGKDGRHSYCKPCHNARGSETIARLYGDSREYHLRRRYGIDQAEFDEMMLDQGDLCAICQESPAEHVDHDHETGEVRGLTCFNCNVGLGNFKDRVDIMAKAITYFERTRNPQWQKIMVSMDAFPLPSPRPGAAVSATSSERQRPASSRPG